MSMNKDQVRGRVKEARGKIKEVASKIMGNKTLQAKGNAQRVLGQAQEASSQVAAPAVTKVTEQTGRVVINPQFDTALRFADGLSAVRIGDEKTGK